MGVDDLDGALEAEGTPDEVEGAPDGKEVCNGVGADDNEGPGEGCADVEGCEDVEGLAEGLADCDGCADCVGAVVMLPAVIASNESRSAAPGGGIAACHAVEN